MTRRVDPRDTAPTIGRSVGSATVPRSDGLLTALWRLRFLGGVMLTASMALGGVMPGARAADEADSDPGTSSVAALAWMEGHWTGEAEGVEMEELWLAPKGGLMVGVHRDLPPSGRPFFEFLLLLETPEGVVYRASPAGRPATDFRLTRVEAARAGFENPDPDFPQRIEYWRDGDHLHARVEGGEGDSQQSAEWSWRRRAAD